MDLSNTRRERRLTGVPSSIGEPIGSKAVAAYLDDPDRGLVVVERDGRVALCSPRARLLLAIEADREVVGRHLRRVLADLGRAWREARGLVRTRPRGALRRDGSTVVTAPDGQVACAVRTLPGAGWAVTVEERRPAAAVEGHRDPVTGLEDRAAFRARLAEALRRPDAQVAVLAIGLDRFRPVNDTLGHASGDGVRRMAAGRLHTTLRRQDGLARLGGDAFAVMQDGAGEAPDAEPLADRIVDLLGRAYVIEGHLVNIGASVGVALSSGAGGDADTLLKHADLALDRAKRDGRATARFFETGMDACSQARRALEIDLRRALVLDQFELVYQPQMDLDSDRLVGCEALIRWHHPTRGTVSPAEFIPLAEEIGLIVPIGEWVLRTACREAARWPGDVTVAVNLSPAQFRSPALVGAVASALAAAGLAPGRLELEITEGLLLQESQANIDTLNALRALGPRIAMDDFGTGYASLSSLRAFPFDRIKIDRSFVSGPKAERDAMAVVRAIASLGATYGMTTIAEGVETPEQMRDIRSEGCTAVQGYHIGRPMPAAAIARLFADQADTAARSFDPQHSEPRR
jgi:diguanylate cyclase (GGDEF)-like protein